MPDDDEAQQTFYDSPEYAAAERALEAAEDRLERSSAKFCALAAKLAEIKRRAAAEG